MPVPTGNIETIEAAFNGRNMLAVRDTTWSKMDELFESRRLIERASVKIFSEQAVNARDNKVVCYYLNALGALCRGYITDIDASSMDSMRVRMQDMDQLATGRASSFDKDWVTYHHVLHFGLTPQSA